jgi:hypothetical protein
MLHPGSDRRTGEQRSEMGFGDKFKNLAKQAQDAVVEHKEQLQDAVDVVSAAANEKTHGKHATRIAKMSEKAGGALDKFGSDTDSGHGTEADPAPAAEAAASSPPEAPAGSPSEAPASSPSETPATPITDTPAPPAETASAGFPSFEE